VRYVVSVRGGGTASVDAPNWLAALGVGLDQFGGVSTIDRLACEVLVNGTVLARDARTGRGYVVRPIGGTDDRAGGARTCEDPALDEDTELGLGDPLLAAPMLGEEVTGEEITGEGFDSGLHPDEEDSELLEFALPGEPGLTEEFEIDEAVSLPAEADSASVKELPTSAWNPVELVEPVEEPEPDPSDVSSVDPLSASDPVGALAEFNEDPEVFMDDDITGRFQTPRLAPVVVPGLAAVRDAIAIGPACEVALQSLQQAIPAEAGSVVLREPDGKLRFALVTGPNAERLSGSVLPKGAGIAGFCSERSTSLIVRRVASDPRFYEEVDRQTGFATRSVLCVPIVAVPDTFGCIELLNPPSDRPFLGGDLRTAQDVAEALAVCIRRERLAEARAATESQSS